MWAVCPSAVLLAGNVGLSCYEVRQLSSEDKEGDVPPSASSDGKVDVPRNSVGFGELAISNKSDEGSTIHEGTLVYCKYC